MSVRKISQVVLAGSVVALMATTSACSSGSEPAAPENLDVGPAVAGQINPGSLEGVTLTYANSGGILQESQVEGVWKPLSAESGATVLQDTSDMGKLKAMVESGAVQWDLFMEGNLETAANCGTLFEKLDYSKIDISKVPDGTISNECMVPNILYGYVVAYNTDAFGDNPPTSAADFFDTVNFPGKRSVNRGDTMELPSMMEFAWMADGKDPKSITPEEIPSGLDKYKALGDDLISWTSGAQSQQQLESGESVMSLVWSGRGYGAAAAGESIKPLWSDWIVLVDSLAIPKGSKNVQAAHAAINFFLGAEQQAKVSELSSYSPVNVDAKPQLDATGAEWLPANHLESGYNPDWDFWMENYDAATDVWINWTTGS